ncbi:MAG: hypothetical protein HY904_09880 [Deltaproteobacteria bacterium]|nr:hypothetical protein [Deltaproteobacteria bacterium]
MATGTDRAPTVAGVVRFDMAATALAVSGWVFLGITGLPIPWRIEPLALIGGLLVSIPLALLTSALSSVLSGRRPRLWVDDASLVHHAVMPMDVQASVGAITERAARAHLVATRADAPQGCAVLELQHDAGPGYGFVDTVASLPVSVRAELTPSPQGTAVQVTATLRTTMVLTTNRPEVLEGIVRYLALQAADPVVRTPPILLRSGLALFELSPWLALAGAWSGVGADGAIAWCGSSAVLTTLGLAIVAVQRHAVGGWAGALAWVGCALPVLLGFIGTL